MNATNKTLDYYNQNSSDFIKGTVDVDFSKIRAEFLSYLKSGACILDFGCGSGRDSKAFIDMGYDVIAVDGSKELCEFAADYIGQPVICSLFQDFIPDKKFDGIWACASLLHLEKPDIISVMKNLADAWKDAGCFYVSFKYGEFSGERNGRFFTDITNESFRLLISKIPSLVIDKEFITSDVRPGRENEKWLNVLLKKSNILTMIE